MVLLVPKCNLGKLTDAKDIAREDLRPSFGAQNVRGVKKLRQYQDADLSVMSSLLLSKAWLFLLTWLRMNVNGANAATLMQGQIITTAQPI